MLASELVTDECGAGDPTAAAERLAVLAGIELLVATDAVKALADALVADGAVSASQPRDAFHIAIAAANGVRYFATWNFKHIANAMVHGRIASVCRRTGFEPPVIRTPEQLLEAPMAPVPTEEIIAIRRALEAQFGNVSQRIFDDILRKQRESGRTYVSRPPQPEDARPPVQLRTEAA